MRAFIAAEIPLEVKQRLDLMGRIYRRHTFLKSVKPYNMHVTFAFLGEIPERESLPIARFLAGIPETECPGATCLKSFRCFPDRNLPKVLVIEVTDPERKAVELNRKISAFLTSIGLSVEEGREFVPHLTLARIGFPHPDLPKAVQAIEEKVLGLLAEKIIIPELRPCLFQSILHPGSPPVYKKVLV